ncbi:hypothetical protein KCP78_23015 [Salmonella enterica subsp. enterica]|nr:hypothetical protein KCP78_23015 [Salmonella enterica subsp. enterica]
MCRWKPDRKESDLKGQCHGKPIATTRQSINETYWIAGKYSIDSKINESRKRDTRHVTIIICNERDVKMTPEQACSIENVSADNLLALSSQHTDLFTAEVIRICRNAQSGVNQTPHKPFELRITGKGLL